MQDQLAHILKQTEESYRGIHPYTDKRQDGWHVWYAQWLLMLSDISTLLGYSPTASELEQLLLKGDKMFQEANEKISWHEYVARCLIDLTKNKKA